MPLTRWMATDQTLTLLFYNNFQSGGEFWRTTFTQMKRIGLLLLAVLLLIPCSFAEKKNSADNPMSYEIVGAGNATPGYYLVEVSYKTKNKKVSDEAIKRAAVHGVLFRGFSDKGARNSQKPLAGSPANEAQHIDFYKEFFSEDGRAADFASLVPGSRTVKKVDKRYAITATVTVNKELLAKYLQDMGVIRGLNSAF